MGIGESDVAGDGTGYSLTVKKHESYARELKDGAREQKRERNCDEGNTMRY